MFHIIKQIRANRKLYPKLFWQEVITRLFAEMFTISVPFVASKLINLLTQGRWGSDLFSLLAVYLLVTIGENIFTRITRTTHALQNAKIQLLKTKEYIKKFFATDYSLWQSE